MNTLFRRGIGCLCILIAILLLPHAFTNANSTTTPAPASATPGAAPQPCAAPLHISSKEESIAQAVFQAINQSRKDNSVSALQWCNALGNSARQHDQVMQQANNLSHQLPGEPDLGEREREQNITWSEAAENIGYNSDMTLQGALQLHKLMMDEKPPDDGHRQNILDANLKIVGIDILLDTTHDLLWLTEDFATPCC